MMENENILSEVQIKKALKEIENELGQKVKLIREFDRFLYVEGEDGHNYSNKLTKMGKHKKRSVRLWIV